MIELRINVDPSLADALGGCLFEAGAGGVAELDEDDAFALVVYCEDSEHATLLSAAVEEFRARARLTFPEAEVGPVRMSEADGEWETTWLAALQPVSVTDDLVLRPTHAAPAPAGEQTLWFEPAPCFGSGDHPTTRLAARAVALACRRHAEADDLDGSAGNDQSGDGAGVDLLDVGAGSGVLCFVAARCGAKATLGIDIDPAAVAAAHHNAELNQLTERCRFTSTPLPEVTGRFPIVVANIDAITLQDLADSLLQRLRPTGTLLLTGLLEEQESDVLDCFRRRGAQLEARQQEGDWVLLALAAAISG